MTPLEEFHDRARHSARGVTVFDRYQPTPDELVLGEERPIEGLIMQTDDGSMGVLLYMPHAAGGELRVEVRTFDSDGQPRHHHVRNGGNKTEVR